MSIAAARRWPLTGRGPSLEALSTAVDDPTAAAVILTGTAGAGKTRLAEELAQLCSADGWTTHWLTGTPGRTAPWALLAPLVQAPDPVTIFADLREALGPPGGRTLLVVDDVEHVDEASAGVLLSLVESGAVFLLATIQQGAETPAALAALWRSGRARVIEVPPLDALAVDTLLHRVLGGVVDGRVSAELLEICRGNVLFLRELVNGSLDSGALENVEGMWRLTRTPTGTPMLTAMVRRRVADLSVEARAVVEHVAVAEELTLDDLLDSHDEQAVESAEEGGLLRLEEGDGGTRVRIADRVQRDAVLSDVGTVRRRRLAARSYELIERHTPLGPGDLVRAAELRLEAGGPAPTDVLLDAARAAREARDLPAVELLSRAALAQGAAAAPALLLAEVLYETGEFEEADALLSDAATLADDPRTAVSITATHAAVLAFGLDRLDDAGELVRAAESTATEPWAKGVLRARNVMHTLWAEGPGAAMALCSDLEAMDRSMVQSSLTTVDALSGATRRAVQSADPGEGAAVRLPAVAELLALTEYGDLVAAEARARQLYATVLSERSPLAQVWVAHALGRVALARGQAATARRWFQEQLALSAQVSQSLPLRLAVAGASVAAAWTGDEAALTRYEEYDDGAGLELVGQLFPADIAVGRAWRAHARGELSRAHDQLTAAARHSLSIGSPGQSATAAHSLVRLGYVTDAVPLLDAAEKATDSPLVAALAAHARSIASGDLETLEGVAHDLAGLGALLAAAEAAAQGAQSAAAVGDTRRAQALRNISTVWSAECEGALTPPLCGDEGVTQSPLTRREREIATLVSQRLTSREIADLLCLSVRTVDNHLQRVFTKLGVSKRDDVGEALRRTGQARGAA